MGLGNMGRNVKVSIVVPCYNVESYINQCIDSIISQTLRDIEIICVNDGSKDHTLEILKEYASKDERIKLIDKQNSGYGDSMNMGMQAACGEYIGIVESDDFVDQRMFEVLYKVAHKHNADVVKSNFWLYWGETGKDELFEYFDKDECGFAIKPSSYFAGGIFGRKPSIWSAIYRTNFLRENNISFLPTPGASFQDTSFTFKVFATCERMVCLYDAFLHYRQDNSSSSVNNLDKKADFVLKEYDEIEEFILGDGANYDMYPAFVVAFYDACIWAYEGLSAPLKYNFLLKVSAKLKKLLDEIGLARIDFGDAWWKNRDIVRIANDPYEYHMWRNVERYEQQRSTFTYRKSITPIGNVADYIHRRERKGEVPKPFFSIIVPIYNCEKYLRSCLDSIMLQTDSDYELICVNDGSKDNSLSIAEEYSGYITNTIVLNQQNAGPSAARNAGLSVACGKFILFVDSDDYLSIDACETLKNIITTEQRPIDAVIFGTKIFPEVPRASEWHYKELTTDDKYYPNVSQKELLTTPYLNVYSWRYCYKREFLVENALRFETEFKYGEDALFVLTAVSKMKGLLSISDKLYNYRHFSDGSLMNVINKDPVAHTKVQMSILTKMLSTAIECGFKPSKELMEYSCDFIYGCISTCPEPQRARAIKDFVELIKRHNLDAFTNEVSDNCRGFWEYCTKVKPRHIYAKPADIFKRIKRLGAKLIWPSRRLFNDRISDIYGSVRTQQDTINYMQQQMNTLLRLIEKQERLISELKKEIHNMRKDK